MRDDFEGLASIRCQPFFVTEDRRDPTVDKLPYITGIFKIPDRIVDSVK